MLLEKMVTDWYTFYCQPDTLSSMKNCVIYISEYNLEMLKFKINEILNDTTTHRIVKEMDFNGYKPIINFIKRNNSLLKENVMQTEEIEFIKENNSYIVVVKDIKDIRNMNESMHDIAVEKADNDTIFIALFEEAQIITIRDAVNRIIKENSIPVFALNIRLKD